MRILGVPFRLVGLVLGVLLMIVGVLLTARTIF
jgi:hypothetical protein